MKKLIPSLILLLLGIMVFAYTIYYLPPSVPNGRINLINLGLLLGSLLVSVATLSFFLLYLASFIWLRISLKRWAGKSPLKLFLKPSLRRGLFVGLFVLVLALLMLTRTNNLLNLSLLLMVFVLLETYFWK